MDLPVRKKLPHTIPQWVADGSWFFITINCVPRGKNQLCRADTGNAVLAAVKFHHELNEKTSYVLMNPVRKGLCESTSGAHGVPRPTC